MKDNGFYDNTLIAFTTDNGKDMDRNRRVIVELLIPGGAVKMGGNNWPLRGTKGTLFEENDNK